ncbi:MAG: DUF4200 domain-containing protein [Bacteroidetes bacterium]|nr:DUF4200 domain-containing protein [Bacteroidota bacterium]
MENRYKLIEKKREMFLVQQMLQTKDEEMERLADHNDQRQTGLHCAALMLETDTKSFLEFFAKIKQEQHLAGKELEKKTQEREAMSEKLKNLQNKCSTYENGNNKTID